MQKFSKALSNNHIKRWEDIHDDVVFKSNITWHRAINMSPMQPFRSITGINSNVNLNSGQDDLSENNYIENNTIQIYTNYQVDDESHEDDSMITVKLKICNMFHMNISK